MQDVYSVKREHFTGRRNACRACPLARLELAAAMPKQSGSLRSVRDEQGLRLPWNLPRRRERKLFESGDPYH